MRKARGKKSGWFRATVVAAALCAAVAAAASLALYLRQQDQTLARAKAAFETEQYQLAASLAEQYMQAGHANDREVILLAARAYAYAGRWELAEAYFAQVPLRRRADLQLRAKGLLARELWSEAAAVYEQILKRWPSDSSALKNMAVIRMQQNRPLESLVFARRLAQLPGFRVTGLLITGYVETHLGNTERAIKAFEEALKLSPSLTEEPSGPGLVYQLLARAYLDMGKPGAAEKYALKAHELTTDPEPCWILGRVRQIAGDETGAEQYWQEALARSPQHAESLVDLAQLYFRRGQLKQAVRFAEQALQVEPETESVQRLVRMLRARLKRQVEDKPPETKPAHSAQQKGSG